MKKNPLPTMMAGTFEDLFHRKEELEIALESLIRDAAKRITVARKGYPVARLEALLGLSRNTYYVAENPWGDKTNKAFDLTRLAEIYSATVKAVSAMEEISQS